MDKAARLIKELQGLVALECYQEALDRFTEKSSGILGSLSHSSTHKKLLLLAAKINIRNHLAREAGMYMDLLIEEYPGIEDDFDYVILKIKKFLLQSDYDNCSIFLTDCQKNNWDEGQSNWLEYYTGMIAFWKGNYFRANRLFEECRELALSSGDGFLTGCCSYMMGYVAFQRCFFEIAEVNYSRALESFDKCGKYMSQGHTYKMLAILACRTGEYDKAEEFLQPAVKFLELTGSRGGVISSNIVLGRINIFRGQYEEAEVLLLDSREKALEAGFRRETALSSEFLGEICYHQGRYGESLVFVKEAGEIAGEIAPEGDVAVEVSRRLGEVYIALGRIEDAEIALSKSHRLCENMNDKYELGSVLRAYGMIAFKKHDMDLAMSFFNEAAVTLKLIKESFELGRTLQLVAETCEKWIAENDIDMQTRDELLNKAKDNAVEALHLFSTKNLDDRAEICRDLVHRLEGMIDHSVQGHHYRKIQFDEEWLIEDRIVAASDSMKKVISRVRKLAPGDMSVLVSGETGTGKEIVAGLLHRFSSRSEGPFVPVNCAAIPDAIFESELFGYRKGAFTGALRDKAGLFEEASGGTLFLDEITELTARQQAKLLRAVQEQCVRRVGETTERPVDIRLVSASNQDIWSMVESGKLRKDFYYRISGGAIELEPLRNRKDDILPLFSYYLCGSGGVFSIEEGLTELLLQYHWPGNVRELINIAEELALLGQSGRVARKRDLPLVIRSFILSEPRNTDNLSIAAGSSRKNNGICSESGNKDELRRQIEIGLIKHNGNKSAIARELGIGRATLYRRLLELEIS